MALVQNNVESDLDRLESRLEELCSKIESSLNKMTRDLILCMFVLEVAKTVIIVGALFAIFK